MDDQENDDRLVRAPWTPEQVDALNKYQHNRSWHPYTCSNRGDGNHRMDGLHDLGILIATADGWICPYCEYTQSWAHKFTMDIAETSSRDWLKEDLDKTE